MVSVLAAVGLVLAKLAAGFITNSLAVYSEAGHSAIDLLAACVSFIAIRQAGLPPDREHPFGHAKFESVGALVELAFLGALGCAIVYGAVMRLMHGVSEVHLTPTAVVLIALTVSVDLWRTISLQIAARQTKSEALAASAAHFLSDLLGTLMVVFGLVVAALGYPKADPIAALCIAGLVFILSIRLGRQVFFSLTDRAPVGLSHDVEQIVLLIPRVRGVHDVRIRQAGAESFADMHVELDPSLSLNEAHQVLDTIELTLQRRYPLMKVTTHPEPQHGGNSSTEPVNLGHGL
jgi:cation diffusion facilitator family transporter